MSIFDLDEQTDVRPKKGPSIPNYRPDNFRYKNQKQKAQPKELANRIVPNMPKGRIVDTSSEAWRRECFARHIAQLPLVKAMQFVEGYEAKHGALAAARLSSDIAAIESKGYLDEMDLAL